jgi:IK cytokine
LKLARSSDSAANVAEDGLDRAKMAGKFKPIGAPDKPLEKEKTKRRKRAKDGAEDGERKRKKRRIEGEPATEAQRNRDEIDEARGQKVVEEMPNGDSKATPLSPTKRKAPTPPDDDDIFAEAGEYKGLELSDEDEDEDDKEERPKTLRKPSGRHSPPAGSLADKPIRNWFGEPVEPDKPPASIKPSIVPPPPAVSLSASSSGLQSRREEHGDDLIEGTKLRGLTSSAVPSIKDLLAIDEAAEREEKRKAKKEKKKAKKLTDDVKLNREVKRCVIRCRRKQGTNHYDRLDKYISEKDK